MIIDGRKIAAGIIAGLKGKKTIGKIVVILVGEDAASLSFVRQKERVAKELGIPFEIARFKNDVSEDELVRAVRWYSFGLDVSGIIVQLDLPRYISEEVVLSEIGCAKDIDCLSGGRQRDFFANPLGAEIAPPAVGAVRSILGEVQFGEIRGKDIVIVGRGDLTGKPVTAWFKAQTDDVTVLLRETEEKEKLAVLKSADLIVSGVGKNRIKITGEMIKPGALVIDFGCPADADAKSIDAAGGSVTPTPGGTGPVLVAELFKNFLILNAGN